MLPAADPAGVVGAGDDPVPGSPGPVVPIRPLTFRELLDLPFALIQANPAALAALGGGAVLVAEVVVVLLTASVARLTDDADAAIAWTAVLTTLSCAWLVRVLLRATVVPIALAAAFGGRTGVRAAVSHASELAGPVLLAHALFTLVGVGVSVLGILLITLPFVVVWLGYLRGTQFPAPVVLFAEPTTHRQSVARAKLLTEGTRWRLTGLWLVQRTLFTLLAVPLFGVMLFVSDITGTHRWPVIVLFTVTGLVLAAFGEIVESCARVVCYVDLRCRREGMDIVVPRGGQARGGSA
ncbi:hypothetical protein [Nocardia farcinica]|uniref:hypothetical protein n=1 Tax=Nocardia farcinica TaxID=37329 RepID=UPI002456FEDA|nr:hypothetical protein [Nocardia farcinica]